MKAAAAEVVEKLTGQCCLANAAHAVQAEHPHAARLVWLQKRQQLLPSQKIQN